MKICLLDSGTEKAWDDFVNQHEHASIYHLSQWRHLINQQFGHSSEYLYAKQVNDGAIIGVLPIIQLKSRLFGHFMVSMPYFNYGGALADSSSVEVALMKYACERAKKLGVGHIEFRDIAPRVDNWPVRMDKVAMILEFPESADELWKTLGAKRRAQIKRPLREGMEIIAGGVDLIDEFYEVFARNMRDLGTPVYAKDFFLAILNTFHSTSHIVIIRHKNRAVAAAFLLGWRSRMEIPWASTLREANPLGVNMLLYWEVLKFSIEKGYKSFDFGRSTIDSGTYRFKKQWGAKPQQHYWHYWLRPNADIPQLTTSGAKYQLAISIWKKIPVGLTKLIGPSIVKNLP